MDPALQDLIRPGAGPPDEQLAVILRLRDATSLPAGVRVVARFGDIVTARVSRSSIRRVWADDRTASLKASRTYGVPLEPISDTGAASTAPQRPNVVATGRGAVIGMVDWGWDIAHPDLRRPDGTTRLLSIWDQRSHRNGSAVAPYGYGRVITAAEINSALGEADPYASLGYDPADFDSGSGAHGTHTASIAAAIARDAEFVFVNPGRQRARDQMPLGDSCELLEALDFIDRVAGSRSCVINMSLGRHAGEHTGRTCVEMAMDQFLSRRRGRAIVQSAGNYFERRTHTSWQLAPGEVHVLEVAADPGDPTRNEIDIWYPGRDRITVEVSSSDGRWTSRSLPGSSMTLTAGTTVLARVYHRLHDPNNGDNQCTVFLEPSPETANWQIRLFGDRIDDGRVHAWIERDSSCTNCQARFPTPGADPKTTIGSIANGYLPIVVGAYDPHDPSRGLGRFSSSGPTRDGRQKPDLLAPGVMIDGALSRGAARGRLHTRMSGTSMAAPAVAGTVALMFQAAGGPLTVEETRRALLSSCQPAETGLDSQRTGYGYLDIAASVAAVTPTPNGATRVGGNGSEATNMHIGDEASLPRDGDPDGFEGERIVGPLRCPMFAGDPELRDVREGRLRLAAAGTSAHPAPVRSTGSAVRKIQLALIASGNSLAAGADGVFGPETGRAVTAFKLARGISPADPVVGPQTIIALDSACAGAAPPEPQPSPCRFAVASSGRVCADPHPAPAPPVPIPVPPPPKPDEHRADVRVAIVGGGFAGLMAAWSMHGGGPSVTVFEGRDRIGGRVRSDTAFIPGKVVEAGAELIGDNHPTWIMLARTFGLDLKPLTTDEDFARRHLKTRVCFGGRELSTAEKKRIEDVLDKRILPAIGVEAKRIQPLAPWDSKDASLFDNMSVEQAFDRKVLFGPWDTLPPDVAMARRYLEFTIENDNCAPVSRHSYLALLAAVSAGRMGADMLGYWKHTETRRCSGGNEQLATHLSKPLHDVRLSTPVEAVHVAPSSVRVTFRRNDGTRDDESFDYVILAGPPTTWPHIHSNPAFDASKYTVAQGPAVKHLSRFKERFWEKQAFAPVVKSDRIGSVWEGTDNQDLPGGFALSVYSGSKYVLDASTYAKRLEDLYPGYLSNRLDSRLVDWPKEPYILTGYAVPAPSQVTSAVRNLNGVFQNRLLFAGEHTSPGFFGYMEGALQSGLFAAYRIAVATRGVRRPVRSARPGGPTAPSVPTLQPADAAETFDRVAAGTVNAVDRRFETVAAPGSAVSRPLRAGDLVISRGRGSPYVRVDIVTDPRVRSRGEIAFRQPLGATLPGAYATVAAAANPYGRRSAVQVRTPAGLVPEHILVLRPLFGESEPGGTTVTTGPCPDVPVPPTQRPRSLKQPVVHSAVRDVQRRLNAFHKYRIDHGQVGLAAAPLEADCIFGPKTRAAVVAFQTLVFPGRTDHHTGIVGEKTWAQLDTITIGGDGAACVEVTRCGFSGPHGLLSWDEIIGLDVALVTLEVAVKGLPPAAMPSTVTAVLTAYPPNGEVVVGPPPGMSVVLTQYANDPADLHRVLYRADKLSTEFRTILGPNAIGLATVARVGGTSDVLMRGALATANRGAGRQPSVPGAHTSDETAQIPDAIGLFRSGGVQVLDLGIAPLPHWRVPVTVRRQARSAARIFYYSGHGLKNGQLGIDTQPQPCPHHGPMADWLGAADLVPTWTPGEGPEVLILAGCSVLAFEVGGGGARSTGTGLGWAQLLKVNGGSLTTLLGYRLKAPCDHSSDHALGDTIAIEMARRIAAGSSDIVRDWLTVNGEHNVTNASAFDARGFWWVENKLFGRYEIRGPEKVVLTGKPAGDTDTDAEPRDCRCHRVSTENWCDGEEPIGHQHDEPTRPGAISSTPYADPIEAVHADAEFDAKAALMRSGGFDPGSALGPVETAGSGEYRRYERALLTAHPSTGIHEVHGLIMQRYQRLGGPSGYLGYPVTDETISGAGRFNRFQFQGSAITWHPVFGVHEVHGRIGDVYWAAGGPTGSWGYPVTDEYPDGPMGRSSDFEGGTLAWTPAADVLEVLAVVRGGVVPAAGDWPGVPLAARMRYVVQQLVVRYDLPVNGAAGIVGNLVAESGVIPSRIEGSSDIAPMRARNFSGVITDFTLEQIMLRPHPSGPQLPGVGLAQWTSERRRSGMFTHVYNGQSYGAETLRSMDSQIDYLMTELAANYRGVHRTVTNTGSSVEAASDDVVYNFEVPQSVLLNPTHKRPRNDPSVQRVFGERRRYSREALRAYAPPTPSEAVDDQATDCADTLDDFDEAAGTPVDTAAAVVEFDPAERAVVVLPLLPPAKAAAATAWNARMHPASSGVTLDEIASALANYVDLAAVRAAIAGSRARTSQPGDTPLLAEPSDVLAQCIHQFQRKCYIESVQHDGMAGESTLDSLGMIARSGNGLRGARRQHAGARKRLDERSTRVQAATAGEFSASNWFDRMADPSVFGLTTKFGSGLHVVLIRKLRLAERFLLSQPAFRGMTPARLGTALGLTERHGGARPTDAATTSLHSLGIAIDISYTANPWVRRDSSWHALQRAAALIGGTTLPHRTVGEYLSALGTDTTLTTGAIWDVLHRRNAKLIAYLGLDDTALRSRLVDRPVGDTASVLRAGETVDDALRRWCSDIDRDRRALSTGDFIGHTAPTKGFLSHPRNLVVALRDHGCLAWGAVDFGPAFQGSGDIMHFDARGDGVGRILAERTKAWVPAVRAECHAAERPTAAVQAQSLIDPATRKGHDANATVETAHDAPTGQSVQIRGRNDDPFTDLAMVGDFPGDDIPTASLQNPRLVGDDVLTAVADGRLRLAAPGTAPHPAPVVSTGDAIRKVQQALVDLCYPLPIRGVDGKFGDETGRAVSRFKREHRINPTDPVIGRETILNIDRELSHPPTSCPPEKPANQVFATCTSDDEALSGLPDRKPADPSLRKRPVRAPIDWFPPSRRPTAGNEVVAYINGRCAFKDIAEAMKTAFAPTHRIYIAGWSTDKGVELEAGAGGTLEDFIKNTRAQVRALFYDGRIAISPLIGIKTDADNTWIAEAMNRLPNGGAVIDGRLPPLGIHHQKIVVVQGQFGVVAFIGGMDLHPSRIKVEPANGLPYHDVHLRLTGPAAIQVRQVFEDRWLDHPDTLRIDEKLTGKSMLTRDSRRLDAFPTPPTLERTGLPSMTVRSNSKNIQPDALVAIGRTFASGKAGASYGFAPKGDYSAWELIEYGIRQATRWIYVEDQYLVSRMARKVLLDKLQEPTFDYLLMVMNGSGAAAADFKFLVTQRNEFRRDLLRIDPQKKRWGMFVLKDSGDAERQKWCGSYLHSKTWIFDDGYAVVGSANCDNRGYTLDTECVAGFADPDSRRGLVGRGYPADLRTRLWHKHLGLPHAEVRDFETGLRFWQRPPSSAMISDASAFETDYNLSPPSDFPSAVDAANVEMVWTQVIDPDSR